MGRLHRVNEPFISPGTRANISGEEKTYLFGKAVYPPNGHCGPRVQTVYQLIVLLRGSLRVTVNGVAYDLSPGDAILQSPGNREFYRFSPETESEHTWCQISSTSLSAADRLFFRTIRGVHRAPSAVHLLIEEGLAATGPIHADLHRALASLAHACLLRFAAHARASELGPAPPHPALQRALALAISDYPRLHSAADLANRAGLSVARLRALFREAGHESPSAMIWRLKVERAIQLIRSTGLTLNEIAEDCGYANPFHLSRSVRRHTGHSPRHLRQSEWKRLAA